MNGYIVHEYFFLVGSKNGTLLQLLFHIILSRKLFEYCNLYSSKGNLGMKQNSHFRLRRIKYLC